MRVGRPSSTKKLSDSKPYAAPESATTRSSILSASIAPLTPPAGSMLPAGGVKGAMLALTIELLVVALSGAAYGFESDSFFVEEGRPTRIGQAFVAIDPAALAGREVYFERVETLIAAMVAEEGVRLPGERRQRNRARALREGIRVAPELLATIRG